MNSFFLLIPDITLQWLIQHSKSRRSWKGRSRSAVMYLLLLKLHSFSFPFCLFYDKPWKCNAGTKFRQCRRFKSWSFNLEYVNTGQALPAWSYPVVYDTKQSLHAPHRQTWCWDTQAPFSVDLYSSSWMTVTIRLITFFFQRHISCFSRVCTNIKLMWFLLMWDVCMNIWFYLKSECTKREALRD